MAIGSGLGASWGHVDESTYGTYVAPSRWLPGTSFNIKPEISREDVWGIASGRFAPTDAVVTGRRGTGNWTGQVPSTKFGLMLKHLMGTAPTPAQQAATPAYLQAFTFADNFGKFFTAQSAEPLTTGTNVVYTGTGGKVLSAEFSSDVNGILNANVDMAFQNVVDSQSLAAPSYVAYVPMNRLAVKLGAFNSEAAITGVRSASVRIERPQDVERPAVPGSYPEPIMNSQVVVSGTITADFTDKTYFSDRVLTEASTALVLEWTNDTVIASTYYPMLRIRCPKVKFSDVVPEVGGPEILSATVAFTAYLDTTNGLVLTDYMSTDTTL